MSAADAAQVAETLAGAGAPDTKPQSPPSNEAAAAMEDTATHTPANELENPTEGASNDPPAAVAAAADEAKEGEGEEDEEEVDGEEEEDEADEDGEEEEEEEGDDIPEGETAETLKTKGKELGRANDLGEAARHLSWALELKMKELDGEQFHPDSAVFYLEYANALLKCEENSSDLFQWDNIVIAEQDTKSNAAKKKEQEAEKEKEKREMTGEELSQKAADKIAATLSGQAPPEEEAKGGDVQMEDEEDKPADDLQLAWETFECARKAYDNRLRKLETEGKITKEEVMDASFVHVRLADLLTLQEKVEEAAEEYKKALEMRKRFDLPYDTFRAPSLALAIALGQTDKTAAALQQFEETKALFLDYLDGRRGIRCPEEEREDNQITLREIEDNITELSRQQKEGDTTKANVELARKVAREMAGQEKKAQEKATATTTAVLGTVSSENAVEKDADGGAKKKRRVDVGGAVVTAEGGAEEKGKTE
uniref:Uncharacterized protein n=1 Tax=Chromera velia CCMP2878 TaxID=1169474 RepID=A0A0G4FMM9_9ALVE|mmetsp:Transcript_37300/g.73382  ORF Transcript_37300/g.73382 Transcript_37300/m.73382 type:complete len:482 (+) Transcript_37300:193-1638(+)|eukprot:Cvel_17822.t1-p1 / transcript=Cvel_17822.t1 / gene=Cvel_17822 / organism=Chromera_velia_CCMP2878 / gene_product=hypothetical protein / transcript_product=hypothetical protein / location=Cvel_scaffold1444:15575-21625(-) / protein_length=481 / sequence_SO=supercontig / SO=protein_coding / is_pseudo=false